MKKYTYTHKTARDITVTIIADNIVQSDDKFIEVFGAKLLAEFRYVPE